MEILKSDERGRITIPKKARDELGYEPGQPLQMLVEEGRFVLLPLSKDPEKRLDELLAGIKFDRRARRKAEEWLMREDS